MSHLGYQNTQKPKLKKTKKEKKQQQGKGSRSCCHSGQRGVHWPTPLSVAWKEAWGPSGTRSADSVRSVPLESQGQVSPGPLLWGSDPVLQLSWVHSCMCAPGDADTRKAPFHFVILYVDRLFLCSNSFSLLYCT